MGDDFGMFATLAAAIIGMMGGVITRDRQVMKAIKDGDAYVLSRISSSQRDFVRKDELDARIRGMESRMGMIHDEQVRASKRIDRILDILSRRDT